MKKEKRQISVKKYILIEKITIAMITYFSFLILFLKYLSIIFKFIQAPLIR